MYTKTIIILLCLTLIMLLIVDAFKQQQLQSEQSELSQMVTALQNQVIQLEQGLAQRGDAVISAATQQVQAAEQQSELLQQRLTESKKQSQAIDQQINTLDSVVEDLALQRMQQQQFKAAQESLQQEALHAANRISGLQIASMMKMAVVEYYALNDRYPSSNTQVGLLRPESYASDKIHSVAISKGGRITVVYTALSGVDGGAISLTPKDKLGLVEWRCTTTDFETIQQSIPDCILVN